MSNHTPKTIPTQYDHPSPPCPAVNIPSPQTASTVGPQRSGHPTPEKDLTVQPGRTHPQTVMDRALANFFEPEVRVGD